MFSNPFPDKCYFHCEKVSERATEIHPKELEIAAQFKASKRRDEFITARRCAQMAMQKAKLPGLPVLRSPNRSPQWPFSIVGSISHGAGYAAAILCRQGSGLVGIGIDMENLNREIKSNICRQVLTEFEIQKWLKGREEVNRDIKIIFSLKEAIYKCFFPISEIYLGFKDAEIDEITDIGFKARLLKSPINKDLPLPLKIQGTLTIKNSVVLSAVRIFYRDLTTDSR